MSRLTAQHFIFVLDLECESPVWCFMGMVLSSSEVLVVCFQNYDLKETMYTILNEYKCIIVISFVHHCITGYDITFPFY